MPLALLGAGWSAAWLIPAQDKPDCPTILKMGLQPWLDQAASEDPSTHGTIDALDHFTGCQLGVAEKHLKKATAARAEIVRRAHKATENMLVTQWLIHGVDGGTMFQIFMAAGRTHSADLMLRMSDPALQTGKSIPKTLLRDESTFLTKASDDLRAFLPLVNRLEKEEQRDEDSKKRAKDALNVMIESWETIQEMASKLTSIDRLRIYKTLDQYLEPNWLED